MKRRKPNLYYRVYGHKPSRKVRDEIYDNLLFMAEEHKKYNPAIVDIGRGQVMMGDLTTLAGIDENDICDDTNKNKAVNLDEESTTKTN